MRPVTIDNPILNSPFAEPARHFRFDADNRITAEVADGRRPSASYLPVAAPKKKVKQADLFTGVPDERRVENDFVNRVRRHVQTWRSLGHPDVTTTTRQLLEHWYATDRVRRLFFCQMEAVETIVFVTEVAKQSKYGHDWIEAGLRDAAEAAGTALFRLACKMATGTGKTAVMSMLIAWQTLNKRRSPKDNRFTDSFLVVAPGVTIRDRLRVLLPSDPNNYYRGLDIVPADLMPDLGTARLVVTNFHAFQPREFGDAGGLTKRLLTVNTPGAFTETPDQMVARVCRELGTRREIVVLNDEAHHCYRGRPADKADKLTGDDKKEADRRDEEARRWLTGLEAVHAKLGVKAVYDLSATPFYLKGSGYPEGTLFPWVVSDFSLIDAIESGVVKVPRVPVADNALAGDYPKYRSLWTHIRDGLPKKGQHPAGSQWVPPQELQGALESLYQHYQARFDEWERDEDARSAGRTPPVFIVVCNNTTVSRLVFEYVAGRETGTTHPDGAATVAPGKLDLFSNVRDNRWLARPNTILVDSEQFDSDAGLSAEFKAAAGAEIGAFKAEYRQRYPGRDADALTDEDLMREVLNTVGKPGRLGEQVRCVVSVAMLTEGWDANTVTHVLGVRAFGTQLLCEQVVGRGLRRTSYALNDAGHFDPEYADVYGVPFAFIPCAGIGESNEKKVVQKPGKVQAVPERLVARPHLECVFPKVVGYRYEVPVEVLRADFDPTHAVVLTTTDIPNRIENAPLVGETVILTLDHLKAVRPQAVAFKLAAHLQQTHYPQQVWLLPQLVGIVRRWMDGGFVDYGDETFPGMLLFAQKAHQVAEKLSKAIGKASGGAERVRAVLPADGVTGSTVGVSYDTLKTVWTTDETKCHLNLVPEDSGWETKVVAKLERMDEVRAYVKNQNLGFRIPYTHEGRPGNYHPDLIVKIDDGREDDFLNLVIEVSGQKKADKDAKVSTARELWVPAVNNERRFGRWAFLEIDNPDKAMQRIKSFLADKRP